MGHFDALGFSPYQSAMMHYQLAMFGQQSPMGALSMLNRLNQAYAQDGLLRAGLPPGISPFGQSYAGPGCGCIPQPSVQFSGAPAGKGLTVNEGGDKSGWPKGSITTAGGYTIVPEGSTNWSVYKPGQKPGETPMTRVWGDPHVNESDGTRWDFTGSAGPDGKGHSNFRLPDGTNIAVTTSGPKGASVTRELEVTNGADRVTVSGVDGRPTTSGVTHDGYERRAEGYIQNKGAETFVLGGDGGANVKWFRENNGRIEGEITGTKWVDGRYDQVVDGSKKYWVDPALQPPVGSAAWGNQFRSEFIDALGSSGAPPHVVRGLSQYMAADHFNSELQQAHHLFGGLYGQFPGFGGVNNALGGLGDMMVYNQFQLQMLSAGRNAWMYV